MKHLRILFALALLIPTFLIHAQEDESANEEDNTLRGQFEELERKSGNYRANGIRYEVIKLSDLYETKNNIFDSLDTANKNIKDLTSTISANNAEIEDLNNKLQETTNNLNAVTEEKDSISFFGALISKGTYNFILWSIIFGLLLLLLFFIYRFRNSNFLTQQAKSALADLEEEYQNHRRRALEREQKISRQLQDELNKQKK
ncbi:tRNA (guanine-N1)-methyltransferase [Flagellimonas lutimaris]|jgi:tetrahydromethanopterin S-methyltransferase subunit B|uniref:tRNA (Guanine-N1)-methyltransferase n=1 Tax=Flagellimonas lutimaris TaxID=475082 RepID=A0A3A1N5K0_9FLAO|nr:tRNA (guanine-N1)-methyltransferase [Allomuricauda lutimaris]RIV32906.1 tRNA (guanine-N1)-methyltransferase [Allomuricauda lutimaris]|tara:strand:+ start:222610 stop:223215 length:606 start_codon:yes stop_codon:yes gene_type:complete